MASPYLSARQITPGTPVAGGTAVVIAASTAGNVQLVMDDGSFLTIYAVVGTTFIEGVKVRGVNAAGTTATHITSVLS